MEMLRQHPSATIELESLLSLGDNRANRDRIIATLVHNFALDPKFVAIAVRMVQYYANYSDRALGFEDGTTAGRIETTLSRQLEIFSYKETVRAIWKASLGLPTTTSALSVSRRLPNLQLGMSPKHQRFSSTARRH